jgi:hypothetical protein
MVQVHSATLAVGALAAGGHQSSVRVVPLNPIIDGGHFQSRSGACARCGAAPWGTAADLSFGGCGFYKTILAIVWFYTYVCHSFQQDGHWPFCIAAFAGLFSHSYCYCRIFSIAWIYLLHWQVCNVSQFELVLVQLSNLELRVGVRLALISIVGAKLERSPSDCLKLFGTWHVRGKRRKNQPAHPHHVLWLESFPQRTAMLRRATAVPLEQRTTQLAPWRQLPRPTSRPQQSSPQCQIL